ncbi:hypothetical protein BH24PSE2_BH24PSE2_18100 [soil metagenome]
MNAKLTSFIAKGFTVRLLLALYLSLQLAACGDDDTRFTDSIAAAGDYTGPGQLGGNSGRSGGSESGSTIGGSVGDGPITGARVDIFAADGALLRTVTSDTRARYAVGINVPADRYPLRIEATGGYDLVTRRAPDFKLSSLIMSASPDAVANINPYTTMVVETATRLPGGINEANVKTAKRIVRAQLHFGLDEGSVADAFGTPVGEDNVAAVVRASEALGEMIRRTHTRLSNIGKTSSMQGTIGLLAHDLKDGILDGSGSSDERVGDILALTSLQVVLETMRNALLVDDVDATALLDEAIRKTHPSTPANRLSRSLRMDEGMLEQAWRMVDALTEAMPNRRDLAKLADALREVRAGSSPSEIDATEINGRRLDSAIAAVLSRGRPAPPPSEEAPNHAPKISGTPSTSVKVGDVYSFRPQATDSDADELIFGIENRPSWANFNSHTGRISGTPGAGAVGRTSEIVIEVTDGKATARLQPFSIHVEPDSSGGGGGAGGGGAGGGGAGGGGAGGGGGGAGGGGAGGGTVDRKYHPGHYVSMTRFDDQAAMIEAIKPGVVGMQKRYYWKTFEPTLGVYDFSELKSDLDLLAGQGMQLVVFIEDKTFNGELPTPKYLQAQHTLKNRNRGYTAIRWDAYVLTRFKALIKELGQRFDGHPAFEGIAIQETSLSLDGTLLTAHGYTPEKYRDAIIDTLLTARASMPKSQVFWYMNFLVRRQGYIVEIANAVAPQGVAMGGPDILPDSYSLKTHSYPLYDDFKGKMILFNSMQYDSYAHEHAGGGALTKYWTMGELFRFARDELHVNYVFWNRKGWRSPKDSYAWSDAIPVIGSNIAFNQQ